MTRASPILFSGPMVRALLDGHKTQTRRLARKFPAYPAKMPAGTIREQSISIKETPWLKMHRRFEEAGEGYREFLYVREAFRKYQRSQEGGFPPFDQCLEYQATEPHEGIGAWKPSIHLRRVDSRICLEVTGTKLERLQDIDDVDAFAEGISCEPVGKPSRIQFRDLWREIHGPDSWEVNPEVVVLTFAVHHRNIDRDAA